MKSAILRYHPQIVTPEHEVQRLNEWIDKKTNLFTLNPPAAQDRLSLQISDAYKMLTKLTQLIHNQKTKGKV